MIEDIDNSPAMSLFAQLLWPLFVLSLVAVMFSFAIISQVIG